MWKLRAEEGHKESPFLCHHSRWGSWSVPILNLPAMCTTWMPKSNSTMKSLSSAVGVIQADYWHRGGWHAIDCSVLSLGRSFSSHNGREKAPHPHDPDALVYKWCEGSCSNKNWWTEVPFQLLIRSCHHARSAQGAVLSRWIWFCFVWLARGKTLLKNGVLSGHTLHRAVNRTVRWFGQG